MRTSIWIRQHLAALRALLVLTVITGIIYPLAVWGVGAIPGLHDNADGSIITRDGKAVGSSLIGQSFTDSNGNPLVQYFQSRPSAAGTGYDPTSTGASNLGPESIQDTLADPALLAQGKSATDAGFKPALLTTVCSRSAAIGKLEGVDGSRPFCTSDGVGAVLAVSGIRDAAGDIAHPTQVVSINQECPSVPFVEAYKGVKVQCATFGQDYSNAQLIPVQGSAPTNPAVPADAVTASGSGLDPDISPAYAAIQVGRVAAARGITDQQVQQLVSANEDGRALGFLGEPTVDVLKLNLALDTQYPARSQ